MDIVSQLYNFLILNNFSALVTLVVGGSAFYLYKVQKRDEKIKAARIVLSELRNAERHIDEIRQRLDIYGQGDFPSVLPMNSWKVYAYLFATDFDQDELELMNTFYTNCESVEDYIKRDNNFFWITTEERAKVVQAKLADTIATCIHDNSFDSNMFSFFRQNFLDKFSNESYLYSPSKTINNLKNLVKNTSNITTTSCGVKLKKLAQLL